MDRAHEASHMVRTPPEVKLCGIGCPFAATEYPDFDLKIPFGGRGIFPSLNQPLHLGVAVSVASLTRRAVVFHVPCPGRMRGSVSARFGRPARAGGRKAAPLNGSRAG